MQHQTIDLQAGDRVSKRGSGVYIFEGWASGPASTLKGRCALLVWTFNGSRSSGWETDLVLIARPAMTADRCYCPDDCQCKRFDRSPCGCTAHPRHDPDEKTGRYYGPDGGDNPF